MKKASQAEVLKAAMQYQDTLLAYAYGMLRDWAQAEDTVQDAYVVAMEKWRDFTPGTSVFSWVKAIVRLKSLELIRTRDRERPTEDIILDKLTSQALDEFLDERAADHQRDMMRKLQFCMQKITERSLEMILEFYSKKRSYEEMAQLFDTSVEAIRKSLYRIRRTLQACVSQVPELELAQE